MTGDRSRRARSSTSRPRPSRSSRRSVAASSTSASAGETAEGGERGPLGAAALRELALRHGVRPDKALGQHFLTDPNLARAIAADAEVGPGDDVLEIGAGLGSLTVALAVAGARVRAVELDRALLPPLEEAVSGLEGVTVERADATAFDWSALGGGAWVMAGNLPYSVATSIVLDALALGPAVRRLVVMVQREVGERLVASPGSGAYGIPSVKVAYRATGSVVRRVPPEVFWPRPNVESVVVRLDRLDLPPVDVDEVGLWRVVEAGFAERRKTMRNALRRLGLEGAEADRALAAAGVQTAARAEELDLEAFAALARAVFA